MLVKFYKLYVSTHIINTSKSNSYVLRSTMQHDREISCVVYGMLLIFFGEFLNQPCSV